jgi:GNAT superfamily N-acetyltransferase
VDVQTKKDLSQLAEMTEGEFTVDLFSEAGASLSSRLGMDVLRIGGGVATLMANDPTGFYWSRVLGLGWEEPITDELLTQVLDWYRQRGATSVALQVSPLVPQVGWEAILERSGFSPSRDWVKLIRDTSAPPAIPTDLDIRLVTEADSRRYAEVYWAGFEFEDPLFIEWMMRQPTMGHWRTFGAFDGDSLAAVGALFLYGEFGGMSGAATLSAFRNRGAQAALIAVRIEAAAAEGCKWVVSETGAETPEDPNPSLHNLHRLGFVDLYERRNWLMKFSAGD